MRRLPFLLLALMGCDDTETTSAFTPTADSAVLVADGALSDGALSDGALNRAPPDGAPPPDSAPPDGSPKGIGTSSLVR